MGSLVHGRWEHTDLSGEAGGKGRHPHATPEAGRAWAVEGPGSDHILGCRTCGLSCCHLTASFLEPLVDSIGDPFPSSHRQDGGFAHQRPSSRLTPGNAIKRHHADRDEKNGQVLLLPPSGCKGCEQPILLINLPVTKSPDFMCTDNVMKGTFTSKLRSPPFRCSDP